MASRLPIAVAYGDGIGPEIMNSVLALFREARVPLDFHRVEMGKDVYLSGRSNGMTAEAQQKVESCGILFKGPMETPKGHGVKSINVTARKVWNTYANKRVFQSYAGVETVFSRANIPIHLTLIRENIEDTYGGIEHMQTHDVAQCRRLITRPGSLQVLRYAFDVAKQKQATRITCVHKANIMKITDGLFLETFYQVAKEYPQLKADDIIVDDLAMKLVAMPQKFDTLVLPNLQGDIISDLCAGLVGGLGMAPSANIGDRIAIFEAVHGTAPDLVGKGLANPNALLLSGLMMLRHLGLLEHERALHESLLKTLTQGPRTKDLDKQNGVSTQKYTEALIKNLPDSVKNIKIPVPFIPLHVPKPAPKDHEVHVTPRQLNRERTVGVDVFFDFDKTPTELAETLKPFIPASLKLVMVSNRGTQVWPVTSLLTECVNHYRVRIQLVDNQAQMSESDLLALVSQLSKKIRVCSLEMLRMIDEKEAFTKAQGQ